MGITKMRRWAAQGLVALVFATGASAAMAGGSCPPGWNSPVSRTGMNGQVFTWSAGKT